jgi:arylsulfatase A-like enzyme
MTFDRRRSLTGRIAREGMLFTDYYPEQSCTARCPAFLTGYTPVWSQALDNSIRIAIMTSILDG